MRIFCPPLLPPLPLRPRIRVRCSPAPIDPILLNLVRRILRRCLPVVGPPARSGVSAATRRCRDQFQGRNRRASRNWDRTRRGRWSYARPDANLAQGSLNIYAPDHRFGQIAAGSGAAAGLQVLSAPDPALTAHTLDSTVEVQGSNGGMRSSQVAAGWDQRPDAALLRAEDLLAPARSFSGLSGIAPMRYRCWSRPSDARSPMVSLGEIEGCCS